MGKLIGIIFALFLAAIVGVYFLLENPDRFKNQIADAVSESTGYTVQINGSLSWRYWPPIAIQVRQVSLSAGDHAAFADIREMEVDLDLLPVVTGQSLLKVNEITLRNGTATLIIDEQGQTNWLVPPPAESTPAETGDESSVGISTVDAFSVEDFILTYRDLQAGTEYQIDIRQVSSDSFTPKGPISLKFDAALKDLVSGIGLDQSGQVNLKHLEEEELIEFSALNASGTLTQAARSLPAKIKAAGRYGLASSQLQLSSYELDYNGLKISGTATIETAEDLSIDASFSMVETPAATLQSTLDLDLPISALAINGNATGPLTDLQLQGLSGQFDETKFTGTATVSVADSAVARSEFRLDKVNLDRYTASTDVAGDRPPASGTGEAATTELLPLKDLRNYVFNTVIRIDQATLQGDAFDALKIEVNNDRKHFGLTANANGFGGKLVMSMDTQLSKAVSDMKVTLEGLDLASLTTVQGVTGRLTSNSQLNFAGTTLQDVEQTIAGKTVFNVKDGTLDVRPIKKLAVTIDTLRNKESSVSDWPDLMPFNQLVGEHVIDRGLRQGQLLTANLENLTLTALGGINLESETLNYDLTAMFRKASEGQFKVSDQMAGIRWPLTCQGKFTDTPGDLCLGREGAIKELLADIVKQDLKRRGDEKLNDLIKDKLPEEYKDLTKDLLKGLFKND